MDKSRKGKMKQVFLALAAFIFILAQNANGTPKAFPDKTLMPKVTEGIALIADDTSATISKEMIKGIQKFRKGVIHLNKSAAQLPVLLKDMEAAVFKPDFIDQTLMPLSILLAILLFGFLIRKLYERKVRSLHKHYVTMVDGSFFTRCLQNSFFILLFSASSVLFLAVSQIGLANIALRKPLLNFADYTVLLIFFVGTARSFSTAILSPKNEKLRLFSLSDDTAYGLHLIVTKLLSLFFFGAVFIGGYVHLDLPPAHHALVKLLVGTVILAGLLKAIFVNKYLFSGWLERKAYALAQMNTPWMRTARLLLFVKAIWFTVTSVLILTFYVVWIFGAESLFFFLIKTSLSSILVVLLGIKAAQVHGETFLTKGPPKTIHTLGQASHHVRQKAHRFLQALYFLSAFSVAVSFWNIDVFTWFITPTGSQVLVTVLTLCIIMIIAYFMWLLVDTLMYFYVSKYHDKRGDYAKTLVPVLQRVSKALISIFAFLVALPLLNINVVPFLAFFTFFGVALGMGAQSFMKDLISGFLILAERTISVGDWVAISSVEGKVIKINLRTLVLQDTNDTIHTIPHSSVSIISNKLKP